MVPAHVGAVLPILHANGYKLAGPTVLGRATNEDIRSLFSGHGYDVHIVSGAEANYVHNALAETLETCLAKIRQIQRSARARASSSVRPRWPMIVLRTPKGWTGPHEVEGALVEGTFRAHRLPLTEVREHPTRLAALEAWLRSYRPEQLFDESGQLREEIGALAPKGARRMSHNPHANGSPEVRLDVPDRRGYAVDVPAPGRIKHESTRQLGAMLRDLYRLNPVSFRLFCPDETATNRLGAVFESERRCLVGPTLDADERVSRHGRVMEVLSEHLCQGWLEGYVLTGRHGLVATYEAFALVVASMASQHVKWLETARSVSWRARVPSLNYLLTSTCWRNDHNGFSHQGPGFMDTLLSKKGHVTRIYLPPDANCLLAVADHCLRSHDHVNLILIDKQAQLQWLDAEAAAAHCARGASVWQWASCSADEAADVVLACAGDVATLETLAAAAWLREYAPELRVRVVNVVDLMVLASPGQHPHGMHDGHFVELFGVDTPVIFAFHGYAGAVHQLLHGRVNPQRFHVRGYEEENAATPFDMVVQNRTSRFHLAIAALYENRRVVLDTRALTQRCRDALGEHERHIHEHFEDMPSIRDWTWPDF